MNTFDVFVFLAILLAMLLSRQPKRTAVALCALVTVVLMAIDHFSSGWIYYYSAIVIEFSALVVLLALARRYKKYQDRLFFRIMAAFLWGSTLVSVLFTFGYITEHSAYYEYASMVAFMHVVFMLVYSDGFRIACGNIRDSFPSARRFTNSS